MAWIKKTEDVVVDNELEGVEKISKTDAYELEITQAYTQASKTPGSSSMSIVISSKDVESGEVNTTYFTVLGKDGNPYYVAKVGNKEVKKYLFGLNIVNTLFGIALGKEVFDVEPSSMKIEKWNNDAKAMEEVTVDGFPDLIGKKIGACVQMHREINGQDSKEYANIAHFFDPETGLFYNEEDSDKRKLDKWLNGKKEFITKVVEDQPKRQSSFGKKKDSDGTSGGSEDGAPKASRWGRG